MTTSPRPLGKALRISMINWYTKMPGGYPLAFGAFVFYCGLGMNILVVMGALLNRQWALFWMVMAAIVLPGIVQGLNVFVMSRLLNPDTPFATRAKEASYHVLCLGRGIESYRYLKGTPPLSWSAVCKDRLGNIALCTVPAAVANIIQLLSMDLKADFLTLSLAASTLNLVLSAPPQVKLCHGMTGEPGNCQKYRYWDLEDYPMFNVSVVLLLDTTQVVYRILLFALLAKFIGFAYVFVFVSIYQAMAFRFLKMGLSAIPKIKNPSTLAFTAAIEIVAFDYVWLEPVPAYKFYVENCYAMRVWQAVVGFLIIGANWEKSKEWNQNLFWFLFISCVTTAAIYFVVYALYVFYYSAERSRSAYDTVDEFLKRMSELKVEMNAERQSKRRSTIRTSTIIQARQPQPEPAPKPAECSTPPDFECGTSPVEPEPSECGSEPSGAGVVIVWPRRTHGMQVKPSVGDAEGPTAVSSISPEPAESIGSV